MKKPLASCVCVTYDRPYLINELLFCFLAQDYENKELIILNDQANIKYHCDNSGVKIYNLDERFPSLGAKREYSRTLTNGEYIFIMDDDDIYYTNHISRLIEYHMANPQFDIVANAKRDYSEWNKNIQFLDNWTLPLNGGSVTKEYWDKTFFSLVKSCGEDNEYVQEAKISHIKDNITSFHYRWGMDVWHISGLSGDGIKSYKIVTKKPPEYQYITKKPIQSKLRSIFLKPQISDDVKTYYK